MVRWTLLLDLASLTTCGRTVLANRVNRVGALWCGLMATKIGAILTFPLLSRLMVVVPWVPLRG